MLQVLIEAAGLGLHLLPADPPHVEMDLVL